MNVLYYYRPYQSKIAVFGRCDGPVEDVLSDKSQAVSRKTTMNLDVLVELSRDDYTIQI